MDKSYWNRMGKIYRDEIFSVAENDKSRIIKKQLKKFVAPGVVAADFGCGIGGFIPILSEQCKKVYAADFSESCLQKAKTAYGHLINVSFHCADLTVPKVALPKVDFILCVNAVITSSLSKRAGIFKNIASHLKKDGHLFLVVPSLESALFANFRLVDWNLRDGLTPAAAVVADFDKTKLSPAQIHQGVVAIDGVPTKHYLKEELTAILEDLKFKIRLIAKVEYGWDAEFNSPPKWMKAPYPWDWLVVAAKK
jgi:2-polyprenyl-3-methyl-5-hydroxy-6-metoxy-1,4-benzoquinol methylase